MHRSYVTLLFLMALPVSAQLCLERAGIAVGYRQDNLDWNIAGPNNHPNVLSELEWTHIQSAEVSACAGVSFRSLYLRAGADYGRIYSGTHRDSDYSGDHRTFEFSHSRAQANRGEVFDLSGGLGWQFQNACGSFICTPLVGYSLDEQHLTQRKGVQLIDTKYPLQVGSFPSLHSSYRAKWIGPWIGLESRYQLTDRIALEGLLEYHWPRFEGTGHWNLRYDFIKDFEHKANGNGVLAALSGEYQVEPRWSIGLLGIYRKFTADRGRDRKFVLLRFKRSDGTEFDAPASFDTRLNRVQWTSFGVKIYGSYCF